MRQMSRGVAWFDRFVFPVARPFLDEDFIVAAAIYALLIDPVSWIHRRVEAIEFIDDRLIRRRVSIDFTVPAEIAGFMRTDRRVLPYVPLTLLRKRTLRNFDLDSAEGAPIPVLTKAENEAIAARSLVGAAGGALGADPSSDVADRLFHVASTSPESARAEIASWQALTAARGEPLNEWNILVTNPAFLDYANALADNFILLAVMDPDPGERRIVKLGYDEQPPAEESFRRRVVRSFGWRQTRFEFEAAAVSQAASYHLEVTAPIDLEVTCARLHLHRSASDEDASTETDMRPGARAHLYVSGVEPGSVADVVVDLHARRSGLLRAAVFVSGLSSLLLLGADFHLARLASPGQAEAAATILLLVPTLLAAYVVRPGEHHLATSMLVGVRLLVVMSASATVFGAGLLAVGYSERTWVDEIWLAPLALSLACTVGLAVSYTRPFHDR